MPSAETFATGLTPEVHTRLSQRSWLLLGRLVDRFNTRVLLARQRQAVEAGELTLGRGSYGAFRIVRHTGDRSRLEIGRYCSIGDNTAFIVGGNHPDKWTSTYPFRARFGLPGAYEDGHPQTRGPIVVEHDVWIGRQATILSGVTIGSGAIVAASSVVTKTVRPYAVVAGNPAREIRRRFSDAMVDQLLTTAWWNWDDEAIHRLIPLLNDGSVEDFLAAASSQH